MGYWEQRKTTAKYWWTKECEERNKGNSLIDFPHNYVVIDLETTGLDPDYCDIIEIGAVKYINDTETERLNLLVKPQSVYIFDEEDDLSGEDDYLIDTDGRKYIYIDAFIKELTGITNKLLESGVELDAAVKEFLSFVEDYVLVGHNVNFDINFLYDAILKNLDIEMKNDFIDTMRISRRVLPELPHHRLRDLVEYYNVHSYGAHRALADCLNTQKVLEKLKIDAIAKFCSVDNLKETYKKHRHGVCSIRPSEIVSEKTCFDETHPLYGKVCVFTGTLEKYTRSIACQIVADAGGINGDSVTAKTNFLIVGSLEYNPQVKGGKSNKQKKAEELIIKGKDIQILSEKVFYDMIQEE